MSDICNYMYKYGEETPHVIISGFFVYFVFKYVVTTDHCVQ